MADCLNGVICQRLLPRADGQGRALATEALVATAAVRNLIRERQLQQVPSLLQTSAKHGMHTMDASLLQLFEAKTITRDAALAHCRDPQLFPPEPESVLQPVGAPNPSAFPGTAPPPRSQKPEWML